MPFKNSISGYNWNNPPTQHSIIKKSPQVTLQTIYKTARLLLKVHKRENFLGSDFKFKTFL
jgi:hypothetical protein